MGKKKKKKQGSASTIIQNYLNSDSGSAFADFLNYAKQQEQAATEKADKQAAEEKAEKEAYKATGSAGYESFKSTVQKQLDLGLIDYEEAVDDLRDYGAKYDLSPEADINVLTESYLTALPGKRKTQVSAAYEEILGRAATEEEIEKAQTRFTEGYYGSLDDFKKSLESSSEYKDKFNNSYLDNYYDTKFGKQTVDEAGKKTGKRTFTFSSELLPKYSGDLEGSTGISTPEFGDTFTGTAGEIEEQLQNVRDTRQFLYSAGLTNLQGEIDKETQKLKNEGSKEVAKINRESAVYSNLVSGFWG